MGKLPIDIDVGLPIDLALLTKSQIMLMLKSTIHQRTSDKSVIISMPIYNGRLLPLERGLQIVVVYTIKEVGRFEYDAVVEDRLVENGLHLLSLAATSEVKKSQRRNFFRVPFFETLGLVRMDKPLPEEITLKLKEEYEKKIEKYKDRKDIIVDDPPLYHEKQNVECRDISGGGLRCLSSGPIAVFEVIKGILHLEGFSIEFTGEVIRVSPSNDTVYPYEIGIKFNEMDDNSRARLIGYIFKKQRNLMKKG